MSTKCTILLTANNEHWYREQNAAYYEETKTEQAIILEIDPIHKIETTDEGTRIIIEEGTNLYKAIMELCR
jgi:hypothetical protein